MFPCDLNNNNFILNIIPTTTFNSLKCTRESTICNSPPTDNTLPWTSDNNLNNTFLNQTILKWMHKPDDLSSTSRALKPSHKSTQFRTINLNYKHRIKNKLQTRNNPVQNNRYSSRNNPSTSLISKRSNSERVPKKWFPFRTKSRCWNRRSQVCDIKWALKTSRSSSGRTNFTNWTPIYKKAWTKSSRPCCRI
jgi:hypothetical protein